jgi:hypothetical protein
MKGLEMHPHFQTFFLWRRAISAGTRTVRYRAVGDATASHSRDAPYNA